MTDLVDIWEADRGKSRLIECAVTEDYAELVMLGTATGSSHQYTKPAGRRYDITQVLPFSNRTPRKFTVTANQAEVIARSWVGPAAPQVTVNFAGNDKGFAVKHFMWTDGAVWTRDYWSVWDAAGEWVGHRDDVTMSLHETAVLPSCEIAGCDRPANHYPASRFNNGSVEL